MKTIIVDDEPWMLRHFQDECGGIAEIELLGSFQSPLKALEFAAEQPLELAFLDIEMPKMDGIELAGRLRELWPEVIIILVSAYDTAIVRAKKGRLECIHLAKPYNAETLRDAITAAVAQKTAAARS